MARSIPIKSLAEARQRNLSSFLCLWALLFLTACAPSTEYRTLAFTGATMGTTYNVTVVLTAAEEAPADLQQQIDFWLAQVNQSMSTFIADSELMELNRAPTHEWLPVSEMMAEVLAEAERISLLSEGAFDITVGPLVDLWGFGPVETDDELPNEEALAEVRARIGFEHLNLRMDRSAIKKEAAVRIDLSAIAKGFGADYVGRQLQALGLENYLVEIGGDLAVRGHNQKNEPWRIGVERPSYNRQAVQEAVAIQAGGVATSGDYRNFYQRGGQIYSHILDPRKGRPVKTSLMSVTVVAESAAQADGLATAMTVMGAEEALATAEREGIAVYLIIRDGEELSVRQSSAFADYLLRTKP